jgi:hypothetical protein
MAKIKAAGSTKKSPAGPKNPGAVGCIFLIATVFILVCLVLYFSIARQ